MMASTSGGASAPADDPMPVTVREADGERDAWYLQRQWHHWFGAEYESQTALQYDLFGVAGWKHPDDAEKVSIDSFGVIAEHSPAGADPVRVGGALALLLDQETTVEELPAGRFDAEALAGGPTAWFCLGVVDGAWRGRGIGSMLFNRRLQWARQTDAEIALSCGWERDGGGTSRPLFEKHGFVPVQTINEMYRDTERTSCPDCGVAPTDDAVCTCDGTVWALDLPDKGDSR